MCFANFPIFSTDISNMRAIISKGSFSHPTQIRPCRSPHVDVPAKNLSSHRARYSIPYFSDRPKETFRKKSAAGENFPQQIIHYTLHSYFPQKWKAGSSALVMRQRLFIRGSYSHCPMRGARGRIAAFVGSYQWRQNAHLRNDFPLMLTSSMPVPPVRL